jgi:actin-related protein
MSVPAALIIDTGSHTVKAGVAGREAPSAEFPSLLGTPKRMLLRLAPTSAPGSAAATASVVAVGSAALARHSVLALRRPVQHGRVVDWEGVTALWAHALRDAALAADAGVAPLTPPGDDASDGGGADSEPPPSSPSPLLDDGRPVLLVDSPFPGKGARELAAQVWFESLGAQQLYMGQSPVCALYAAGETQGVVVDAGHGLTAVAAVYEGVPLQAATARVPVAGADVTTALARALLADAAAATSATGDSMRSLRDALSSPDGLDGSALAHGWPAAAKAAHCRVALDYAAEVACAHGAAPADGDASPAVAGVFTLPDGAVVPVEPLARITPPEALFQPSLVLGRDAPASGSSSGSGGGGGIGQALRGVLAALDPELRAALPGNLLVAGGSSLLAGFPDRVELEARAALQRAGGGGGGGGTHVRVLALPDRQHAAFVGASVLASLSRFTSGGGAGGCGGGGGSGGLCLSRSEYEEEGQRAVAARFFA